MKAIKVCWSETTVFVCKITQEDVEGTEYTLEGLLEDPWEAVALTYEWELPKDSTDHDETIAEAMFIEEE